MESWEIGRRYEGYAASYLADRGYRILEQNFHCRQGEIDLIAQDGRYLVFIEVKYRRNKKYGEPTEAVDWKKQQRIRRTAKYYLHRRGYSEETPCRFDVVGIASEKISVIQNAF